MAFCTGCGAPWTGTPFCASCGARMVDAQPAVGGTALHSSGATVPPFTQPLIPAEPVVAAAVVTANGVTHEHAGSASAAVPGADHPAGHMATPPGTPDLAAPHAAPVIQPAAHASSAGPFGPLGGPLGGLGKHVSAGQLSSAQTTAAGKDGLVALLGCLAVGTVLTAVLAGVLGSQGHHGSPLDWFQGAVVALGLSVHAALELHVAAADSDGPVSGAVTAGLAMMPFLASFLIGASTYWLGRRSERNSPSGSIRECLSQGALTGAAFGVGAALLALMTTRPLGFGTGKYWFDDTLTTTVGVNPWTTLLGAFVVAGIGAAIGRSVRYARSRDLTLGQIAGAKLGVWVEDLRTARALLFTGVLVAVLAILVAAAWHFVPQLFSHHDSSSGSSSSTGDDTSWRAIVFLLLGGLLMLANLLVVATGFVMGGTLGASGNGDARSVFTDTSWSPDIGTGTGLLAGGVPTTYYLVWIPLLLLTLAAGICSAFRRSPQAEVAPRVWRTVALFAAIWALLSWLTRITVHIAGEAKALDAQGVVAGSAGAGLGIGSTLAAAAVWALVCVLAGSFLTRWVGAALPRLSARLAGRNLDPQWALLLADAVARRGRKMPASLAGATTALNYGVEPDAPLLDVRPGRTRMFFGVAGVLVVLGVAAPISYQVLNSQLFGADATVSDYMDALSQRDAQAALKLVDPSAMKGVDKTLLVSAAIKTPPRIEIVSTETAGDNATVVVKEHFGDKSRRATFVLTRKGHRAVMFDRWVLDAPFTNLSLSNDVDAPGNDLSVNGVALEGYGDYPVFPGTYHVALAESDYYMSENEDVTAAGHGSQSIAFYPSINPDLQSAADAAVADLLDSCAAQAEAEPTDCPISYYSYDYADVQNVQWSIDSYPYAEVTINDDGSITVDASTGSATISGDGTDYFDDSLTPFSDSVAIDSFSGTLSWVPGEPESATMTYDYGY